MPATSSKPKNEGIQKNRFSALMDEATNPGGPVPTMTSPPTPPKQPQPKSDPDQEQLPGENTTVDSEPWLLPNKSMKANPNVGKTGQGKGKGKTVTFIPIPKALPEPTKFKPAMPGTGTIEYNIFKFAVACRLKTKPNEKVSPSRLMQAMLMIFQHADSSTILVCPDYETSEDLHILDPTKIPVSEKDLSPFMSHWKYIREDMVFCRLHFLSESPYEYIKMDSKVMQYLKEVNIMIEKALLESSDHQLVGFLVNVVPDEFSLPAQQYRFQQLLPNQPAFQLIIRNLSLKGHSKVWCNVLKVRVDKADADEISLAFNAISAVSHDFKYYAFDEYTGLHENQKRYIIETQRSFLLQNRSVIVEWNLNDVSDDFIMWQEETLDNSDGDKTQVRGNDSNPCPSETEVKNMDDSIEDEQPTSSLSNTGDKRKRDYLDTASTDQFDIDAVPLPKHAKSPVIPEMHNGMDLRETTIEEFIYSYKSGDGTPLVRYIYPVSDNTREFLVNRSKRAEVNSLLKVLCREIARHMSDLSLSMAFSEVQEIKEELSLSSKWTPSSLSRTIPHSTTHLSAPNTRNQNNKRRQVLQSSTARPIVVDQPTSAPSPTTAPMDAWTSSSSLTASSTAEQPNLSTNKAIRTGYHHSDDTTKVQEQLEVLQKQHSLLVDNVQKLVKKQIDDKLEIHRMIGNTQTHLQTHLDQSLQQTTTKITENITAQYSASINQLREEAQAIDQRQQQATKQLQANFSSEISSAIQNLTNVVAVMQVSQSNFINEMKVKDQENSLLTDQMNLFLKNWQSSTAQADVVMQSVQTDRKTDNHMMPSDGSAEATTMNDHDNPATSLFTKSNIVNDTSRLQSLPTSIGRTELTPLAPNRGMGGRGGGRGMKQQTLGKLIVTSASTNRSLLHPNQQGNGKIDSAKTILNPSEIAPSNSTCPTPNASNSIRSKEGAGNHT